MKIIFRQLSIPSSFHSLLMLSIMKFYRSRFQIEISKKIIASTSDLLFNQRTQQYFKCELQPVTHSLRRVDVMMQIPSFLLY